MNEQTSAPPPQNQDRLHWEDWLAAIAMGVLVVITFGNVLVRYFTSQSFAWSEELSVSLMIILTLAAGSAATLRDRQIRIEFLRDRASPGNRVRLNLFGALCTVLAFGILTWYGARFAYDDYRFEVTSPGIGWPQWWYSIWLPVLALAITLRAAQLALRVWRGQ